MDWSRGGGVGFQYEIDFREIESMVEVNFLGVGEVDQEVEKLKGLVSLIMIQEWLGLGLLGEGVGLYQVGKIQYSILNNGF